MSLFITNLTATSIWSHLDSNPDRKIFPNICFHESLSWVNLGTYKIMCNQVADLWSPLAEGNKVGPIVKHVWNVSMHMLHIFGFVINTTAYHLGRYSLHLLLLKRSMFSDVSQVIAQLGSNMVIIYFKMALPWLDLTFQSSKSIETNSSPIFTTIYAGNN